MRLGTRNSSGKEERALGFPGVWIFLGFYHPVRGDTTAWLQLILLNIFFFEIVTSYPESGRDNPFLSVFLWVRQ